MLSTERIVVPETCHDDIQGETTNKRKKPRDATHTRGALGSDAFLRKVEHLLGRRVRALPVAGRGSRQMLERR